MEANSNIYVLQRAYNIYYNNYVIIFEIIIKLLDLSKIVVGEGTL